MVWQKRNVAFTLSSSANQSNRSADIGLPIPYFPFMENTDIKPIPEIGQRIIREFNVFSNWKEKYMYIIELGRKLAPLEESHKIEKNILHGCMSRVWFVSEYHNGRVHFRADADAAIVKGLVAIMIRYYGGHTPEEILSHNPDFIQQIGMDGHFSATRANGLNAMLKQIKLFALVWKQKAGAQVKH